MAYLITAGFLVLVAVLFAMQNMEPVYVKFLFWNLQAPLAVALVVAFLLGVGAAGLALLAGKMRSRKAAPKGPSDAA